MPGIRRILSALLLLAVCVAFVALMRDVSGARGAEASHPIEGHAEAQPKGVEIKSARTATSDTFAIPGGERETRAYAEPVNYKDAEGDWKPIGEGLEETEGGDLTNGANSFDLTLPRRLGTEEVRIEGSGEWITDRLVGRDTEAVRVEGDTATYEGATPATTFELTSIPTGVKEAIEIEGPSGPGSFSYELDASQGLTPTLEKDGSVVFRRRDESVAAVLPAPTVIDGAPGAEPDPEAVSYGLEALSGGGWRLELTVAPRWLGSPGRVWPATIDPTIEVRDNGTESCQFWMKEPSGEAGPDFECSYYYPKLKAEYSTKAGVTQRYRSLISFAHTEIEHDAWIGSASVNLYDPEEATGLGAVELRPVTKEWNSTANWIYYSYLYGGGKAWEHPGGDFTNEVSELSTAERGTASGWWRFTKGMTQIVRNWENSTVWNDPIKNWIKSTTEYGLLVKLANESPCGSSCSNGTFSFLSENSSNPAEERPYLAIDYYPKAPSSSKLVSPTEGTRTARRLKLRSKWTAAGVEGVTYQYREGKSGPFETIPAELVRNTEGKAVSWPIPVSVGERETRPLYFDAAHVTPTLRKKGGVIQVRALFEGPTEVAGYSAPVEADVNRSLGGPKDATASVGPGSVDLLTGNFSTSDSDVSIPTFNSGLEFSRTFNSRGLAPKGSAEETEEEKSALGPGWKPGVPVEEAGGSEWRNLKIVEEKGSYEEEIGEEEIVVQEYSFTYALLTDLEGGELAFEKTPGGYVAPPEVTGWSLTTEAGNLVLSDPAGDRTTFSNLGSGNEYVPTAISQPGGSGVTTTRVEYELKEIGGKQQKRVHMVVAPTPPGGFCTSETEATADQGCRTLIFTYGREPGWELPEADGERLEKITYYAPGNGGPWEGARYAYNKEGRLTEEWDPRITPALKEKYAYGPNGELKTITPPGQEPWTLEYGTVDEEEGIGRLTAVKRPSLASPSTAQTTVAYEVPLTGSPYEMGGASVAQWGQTDIPVDATAVFPPDQVPSSPPSSYSHATIYYMDAEGHEVNVATPSGAGTSNPSISTSETDEYGNVVRELTPDNRLRVLAEPECKHYAEEPGCKRRVKAEQLETRRTFGAEGTQLEEEIGPLHKVRLESGSTAEARFHKVVQYDHEMPVGTTPDPHLPTRETTGASVEGVLHDERVSETTYDWTLRKPEKTIVVMESGKPNVESVTVYNNETGLPTERRQPKEAKTGGGAGTTKMIYYRIGDNGEGCSHAYWAGLLCKIEPAAQPGTSGQPELLVKKVLAYNALGEPTEVRESPGGVETKTQSRITTTVYDSAGRELSQEIEGGGTKVPKSETLYSATTGLPYRQQFACGSECGTKISYSSSFGSSGTGNGQFAHPGDVARDSKGDLWVADDNNNRLEEFNEKGEYLKSLGSYGTGNGQFHVPKSIAFTAAGNFWVADSGNNRLQEFNEKGEFLKAVGSSGTGNGQFNGPEGIAIDAKGDIWVSDTYNLRVQELNEKGEFIKVLAPSGLGAIEPTGITVSGGDVWVTDWAHNRAVELNEAGELLRQFGKEGTGNGEFKHPDAVAVDASGDVWVGDQNNERVQEFNQKGEYLAQFGSAGTGAGQFTLSYPMGIATDSKGDIWVTDTNDNRVEKWTVSAGVNQEATTATYNAIGQMTKYEDADGNKAETTYDVDGRPVTVADNKGTQTFHYDETSGLLTKLEDSAAGTFTASYDADGNMVERTLPDGITAKTTYDEVDEPTKLAYTKTSSCGESCTWLEEGLERSVYGQILGDTGNLVSDQYSYDKAGRLTQAQETPKGGGCTTREYKYDEDSNRTSRTVREPGVGGVCATSGGSEQKYEYDAADRLLGTGLTYDEFGRITSLPAADAGGHALTTAYYSTNMVARQEQNGIVNSYELDASGRQRARLQGGGGLEGTEIFHYDGPSDSVAWTERGTTWTRDIGGIGGELAAIQESSGGVTFQLTDLHGDVVATAEPSPTATKLKATFRFDEFGEPESGSAGRFGWLGGKSRRTELSSGVVQMGARSYVPQLGRFISTDPAPGGSANPYDYANADPVNSLDLEGTRARRKKGGAGAKRGSVSAETNRRAARSGGGPEAIVGHIRHALSSLARSQGVQIAWNTCVPENELGIKRKVIDAVLGEGGCIPKINYQVSNPTQILAAKTAGWAWCVGVNTIFAGGPTSVVTAPLITMVTCAGANNGERPWAYVHVT
jgi:RHS repeat-associated protein